MIIENNNVRQPAKPARLDCDSRFITSWMPLIGQVDAKKERVAPPQFSTDSAERILWCIFFCFSPIQTMCARFHTVLHMALVLLGEVDFSLSLSPSLSFFHLVVINYTDIVLAPSSTWGC